MNCLEVEEQDILERYVLDRLTDPERDAFEQHYFACDSCFSQLQDALALQEELKQRPLVRTQTGGAFLRQLLPWTPAFATLALLLAAGIWWYAGRGGEPGHRASVPAVSNPRASTQTRSSTPAPSLEELARLAPPPYSAVVLRGAEDEAQVNFRKAMRHYLEGDYAGAIPGLRAAVKASPETARFSFYLGACYLLTSQADSAIASFHKVISLDDQGYSPPAHFYLAKAYLRNKDVSRAEEELRAAAQRGGNHAAEATEILRRLGK
jgi:TolA-binding protein